MNSELPQHLSSKLSQKVLPIIDTRLNWGETNPYIIQQVLLDYASVDAIVYVFLITDNSQPFIVPDNVRFYRTSILKSQMVKNEYLLPYIWQCENTAFPPLPKTEYPIVGFCGLLSEPRIKTLRLINQCPQIKPNFIIRHQFWGGRPDAPDLIADFLENIRTSHFTMCNRGAGNFSMRFYQTLSCGRIPVLVNTDMIFPYEDEIDWGSVIVIANTEEELVEKIVECWKTRDIIAMQSNCRAIFDKYFAGTVYLDRIFTNQPPSIPKKMNV